MVLVKKYNGQTTTKKSRIKSKSAILNRKIGIRFIEKVIFE